MGQVKGIPKKALPIISRCNEVVDMYWKLWTWLNSIDERSTVLPRPCRAEPSSLTHSTQSQKPYRSINKWFWRSGLLFHSQQCYGDLNINHEERCEGSGPMTTRQPTIRKVPTPATMRLLRQRITPNRPQWRFFCFGGKEGWKESWPKTTDA